MSIAHSTSQRPGRAPIGRYAPLVVQALLTLLVLAILVASPARSGPMIVLPLGSVAAKPWLDAQAGVTLLGLGRLPGSMIVDADRNRLLPVAFAHHAILLPALPMLCSQGITPARSALR